MNIQTIKFRMVLVVVLALGLAGCSSAASPGENPAGEPGTASELISSEVLSTEYENALSIESQLAVGIVLLDGTETAVDAGTAAELLPLWKAARTLSTSDSAAMEEIQAVFKQIEQTLSPDQLQAIAEMELNREAMGQAFEQLGIEIATGQGRFGDLTPEMQATLEAARASGEGFPEGFTPPGGGIPGSGPGGGMGGGLGPGMGGGAGGGEALSPEARQTAIAERAGTRAGLGLGVPAALIDAVIEYLESISG